MFDWAYDLSGQQMAFTFCLAFVGFAWLGILLVRPFLRLFVRRQAGFNGLLSSFISVFGIFYGILMGLLAVAAYQNKLQVQESIRAEGATTFSLFRLVSTFPEPTREPLQEKLRDYCQLVSSYPFWRYRMMRNKSPEQNHELVHE